MKLFIIKNSFNLNYCYNVYNYFINKLTYENSIKLKFIKSSRIEQ